MGCILPEKDTQIARLREQGALLRRTLEVARPMIELDARHSKSAADAQVLADIDKALAETAPKEEASL